MGKHHSDFTRSIGNQPPQQYSNPASLYSHDYDNHRPKDPINDVPLTISQMNEQMDDYRLRHHKKPWWLKEDASSFDSYRSDQEYSDKLQITAFLLSLFLGLGGGGRLYIGDYTGYFKLGLLILVCCYPCFLSCCFAKKRGNRRSLRAKDLRNICGALLSCIGCIAFLALIGWVIVDIVLFGLNDIPDADGLTLQP